jgi:hypothetical protein
METNPPTVAGWPSRVDDILTPVWTTVVGGPATEGDPGNWLFVAYTEVIDAAIEAARKLEERAAPTISSLRRVESLGEQSGYWRYRTRSGHLFLVRKEPAPYVAAYFLSRAPTGVTEDQILSDLIRLADFAKQI